MLPRGEQLVRQCLLALAGGVDAIVVNDPSLVAQRMGAEHEQVEELVAALQSLDLQPYPVRSGETGSADLTLSLLLGSAHQGDHLAAQLRCYQVGQSQTRVTAGKVQEPVGLPSSMQYVGLAVAQHQGDAQGGNQSLEYELVLILLAFLSRPRHQFNWSLDGAGRGIFRRAEQTRAPVDRHEKLLRLGNALRSPQKKPSVRMHAEVEGLQYLGLQGGVKIDEHIAAGNQVKSQKGWIAHQVVARKNNHVAQHLARFVGVAVMAEKSIQQVRRHFGHRGGRIHPTTRHIQRVVIYIGGEDLDAIE